MLNTEKLTAQEFTEQSQYIGKNQDNLNSFKRTAIAGTPFETIQSEKGYEITLGNQRLMAKPIENEEEYMLEILPIVNLNWRILTPIIASIVEKTVEMVLQEKTK